MIFEKFKSFFGLNKSVATGNEGRTPSSALAEIYETLRKRGPVTKKEAGRIIGEPSSVVLIEQAIIKLSGRNDIEGRAYYWSIMEALGHHPDGPNTNDGAYVAAYERARLILIKNPKNREELERLMD